VSDAIREDEALATDVEETSEAEVREVSGGNGPDEAETSSLKTTEEGGPVDEFERSAAAAREALIAELQRTVETVSTAVDDATAKSFEDAQAEARRQAEEASARVEALERDGLAKLRELADDLLERSTWLSNQLAELTKQAETTATEIKDEDGPAKLVASSAPPKPAPVDVDPVQAEAIVESANAAIEADEEMDEKGAFGLFRRRRGPDVPDGVRLIISQMRSSGEADGEIIKHLEEMGVKDPERLVSSVKS
jgi:hypothetical protein